MGNTSEEKEKEPHNLLLIKSLTLNAERMLLKNEKAENDQKDFNKFKYYMQSFKYYKKILKLGCRKNPVLKLLYEPESSFNGYNQQMFYFLENIPYVNYNECLHLTEIIRFETNNKKPDKENSSQNKNKAVVDSININDNNKTNKIGDVLIKKSSFKTSNNKPNIKKTTTFDLSKNEQFNVNIKKNITSRLNEEPIKTFNEGLLELLEKICLYDPKKIQKILLLYPINNMRWLIWLSMAKVKYRAIHDKMNISNKEIYDFFSETVDFNDDSLLFELHNTLKELKVYKYNWSNSLYRIIKSLTAFEQDMRYESGMNILIGVPLLISDCNEEETFFFGRYLLSISFGLGLYYFYDENELLLNYLVFIFHSLAKERFPKIYERLCDFKVSDELWIKKWIKTFFSSIFDLTITIRVWDCMIAVGIRFLVNYSLAILEYFEEKIMSFKKVKEFLEFFDYELRKKYKKDKEIITFRENILTLAQSYYIPDGKYQLIEKDYLNFLLRDKSSGPSYQFDTSRTINNYYSNNNSLNDDQYHIKLILRTLVYIPNEFKTNNIEEQNILLFQRKLKQKLKKKSQSVVFSKNTNNNISSDIPKIVLKNKDNNEELEEIEEMKLYSSLSESPEKKLKSNPCNFDVKELLTNREERKSVGVEKKVKEEDKDTNKGKKDDLIDTSENKKTDNNIDEKNNLDLIDKDPKDINKNEDKNKNIISPNEEVEDEDSIFDFTFNEEQMPTN